MRRNELSPSDGKNLSRILQERDRKNKLKIKLFYICAIVALDSDIVKKYKSRPT